MTKWTRDAVIDAVQRFAAEHGRPPAAKRDWSRADREKGYPHFAQVYGPGHAFDSWAEAIEAAGFPRPRSSAHEWTPEQRARLSATMKARAAKKERAQT